MTDLGLDVAPVNFTLTRGRDFNLQISLMDLAFYEVIPVLPPMRMDLRRSDTGFTVLSLVSLGEVVIAAPSYLDYQTSTGLIQIHLAKNDTILFVPGGYEYDLWCQVPIVGVDSAGGVQETPLMAGRCTVLNKVSVI